MGYSEHLAERIRIRLKNAGRVEEKKMMGGLAFMVNGNMCIGVNSDKETGLDRVMARVGKDAYEELLQRKGARVMDFTGKVMKGFLHIDPPGFDGEEDLDFWVQQTLNFNRTLPEKP